MSKTIKQRKKRRTREPFIVISEWKGQRREETRWHFTIEDIQKSIDKSQKNYDYFYNDKRSPYFGNKDYDPANYKLIDILPYPKRWSVLLNDGSKTHDIMVSVNAQTKGDAEELVRKQYRNHTILEIKEGVQIING